MKQIDLPNHRWVKVASFVDACHPCWEKPPQVILQEAVSGTLSQHHRHCVEFSLEHAVRWKTERARATDTLLETNLVAKGYRPSGAKMLATKDMLHVYAYLSDSEAVQFMLMI